MLNQVGMHWIAFLLFSAFLLNCCCFCQQNSSIWMTLYFSVMLQKLYSTHILAFNHITYYYALSKRNWYLMIYALFLMLWIFVYYGKIKETYNLLFYVYPILVLLICFPWTYYSTRTRASSFIIWSVFALRR